MTTKKETKTKQLGWGDGHIVKIRKPKLEKIPGDSVVCPMPCYPIGEDGDEWKKHEEETKRPKRPGS